MFEKANHCHSDEFELTLIRNQLSKANLLSLKYHSLGLSEEDCDQAIINGIRRMGLTKEKIVAAGYNPNIMYRGYFGTGGRKKNYEEEETATMGDKPCNGTDDVS